MTCVSFSQDGRQVVTGSWDKTLRLWDLETFTEIGNPFEGHSDWVDCVCFSSDGHRIVSGGDDKQFGFGVSQLESKLEIL